MEADNLTAIPESHDAEWLAHHPRLDTSLTAAIRMPVVDGRFDEQVWALIRADEAEALATQKMLRMRLGTPWWLDSLNVIAIVATTIAVALAFGAVAARPLAASAGVALAFAEHSSDSIRLITFIVSVAGLWLGLRQTAFARALDRAWF